ncbi:MAG: GNAT family N-acetyltransferase [Armatimonadetes bacterium]|nr:GNAT family N-acetyltransferase [Armatimonadota bacterium]
MEGPRGVRLEEIESLHNLTDMVFRPSTVNPPVMAKQYPQLFNADNYDNLRVCVEGGICVSHVGMKMQDAYLFGCRMRTACIGGVCTHPDFRKMGLASQCCNDAWRIAYETGVDVMLVSGDRDLYRMRGCLRVGNDTVYHVTPETLPIVSESITLTPMSEVELPLIVECYRREPVRFQRYPSDYLYLLQSRWAMNSPLDLWVLRERGDFRGYIFAKNPLGKSESNLIEFAGDRRTILAALPFLFQRYSLTKLHFQVQRYDNLLRSLCEGYGWEGVSQSTSGTVALINFPQLMTRMLPRFEEMIGVEMSAQLRFSQEGDTYLFGLSAEEFTTDRDTATRMVFGTTTGMEPVIQGLGGRLGEALRTILPLPALWYGINYV